MRYFMTSLFPLSDRLFQQKHIIILVLETGKSKLRAFGTFIYNILQKISIFGALRYENCKKNSRLIYLTGEFFFRKFFCKLGFTKDFSVIHFREVSLTKYFAGIHFRESALFKDFAGPYLIVKINTLLRIRMTKQLMVSRRPTLREEIFAGINFRESALFKDFAGPQFMVLKTISVKINTLYK